MLNLFRLARPLPKSFPNKLVFSFDTLSPLRQWLNGLDISNPTQAHLICQVIPAQCPFERDICIGNRFLISIPPLCKLNPLYEEIISLRFRALCYLADECSIDICRYC
jgi:hypothetical protein